MKAETKEKTFITRSPDETRQIGETLGYLLEAGMRIGLQGDLGSGKTVFVQGLARGLEVPTDYYVTSPTYNIINEYPGRHVLFHIDLYRMGQISMLEDLCELEDIGFPEILDGKGVVAIEWADMLAKPIVSPDFSIQLDIMDDTTRKIHLIAYGLEAVNLLENFDSNAIQQPGENR
jgi:tRNA threonylcarbamoyladenosine biosynthesis protein TsaE